MGLVPRLIAPHFVWPYRMQGKTGKNDAADAAAICEAASRPDMRFVPLKMCAQQGVMTLHRLREGYKEERNSCINRIRRTMRATRPFVDVQSVPVAMPGDRVARWSEIRKKELN
jgi:transposase